MKAINNNSMSLLIQNIKLTLQPQQRIEYIKLALIKNRIYLTFINTQQKENTLLALNSHKYNQTFKPINSLYLSINKTMSINIENGQNTAVDNSTEFYNKQSTKKLCQIQQRDSLNNEKKQDNTYEQKTTLDALTNMLNLLHTDTPINRQNNKHQDPLTVQNNNNYPQSTLKSLSKDINKKSKSLFASKHLNIDKHQHQQQSHIITSSHKSFSSIARSKNNIKTTNIQQDNFVQSKSSSKLLSTQNINTNSNSNGKKQKKALKKQDKHVTIQRHSQQQYHIQPISGISLYEQVLAKNFQVIDSLLKKLNQIYSHQQGYDKTIRELSQKMHKLQVDNENIHHEFRTSHFMIDKKLNTISNDHANIMQDVVYIKKVLNYQSRQFKDRAMGFNDNNNKNIKNGQKYNNDDDFYQGGFSNKRKQTKRSRKQKRSQQSHQQYDNNTNSYSNQNMTNNPTSFINQHPSNCNSSFKRSAHKNSILNKRSSRNIVSFSGFKQHNKLGKLLLQQINQANQMYEGQSDQMDSISSSNSSSDYSVVSNDDSREIKTNNNNSNNNNSNNNSNSNSNSNKTQNDKIQIKTNSLSTQNNMNINQQTTQPHQLKDKGRKTSTTKSNQKHHHNNKRHINNSLQYLQINALKNFITKQVQKVSKHNQQLNKFTLLGIQTTINTKCQSLQQKYQYKLQTFTNQLIEQKINKQFRKSLLDQVQQIITNDLNKVNKNQQQKLKTLQFTLRQQVDTKSDKQQVRQDLKQILQLMNKKMHGLVQNCFSKFAERSQTKRAILFLQKKINKLIQAAQKFNFENVNLNDDDQEKVKCLSCNRSYGLNIKDNNNHSNSINNKKNTSQSQQQPMFSQVHLLSQSVQNIYNNNNSQLIQKNELNTNMMTTTKKSNRNYSPDNNKNILSPQNKHTVRFRQLSKYNSVDDIFQTNHSNKHQQELNNNNNKMKKHNQNSSFISSVNKLRHSQTSQSLHLPSSSSTNTNIKSKYFTTNNTQSNKLSTSQSNKLSTSQSNNQNKLSTTSNIKQRNWKQKAQTMLKKQITTINWRSKSQYKKV